MRRRDGAFSLVEVLVAIAVMVTLAAVIAPAVVRMLDRARVDRAHDSLTTLAAAIFEFQADVDSWPAALTQLSEPITTAQSNSCGGSYGVKGGAPAKAWAGPYINRVVPTSGLPVGIGTALNPLVHGTVPLRIVVEGVTEADALVLDTLVDGDDGPAAGTVQWTGSGVVTLNWVMPVPPC